MREEDKMWDIQENWRRERKEMRTVLGCKKVKENRH